MIYRLARPDDKTAFPNIVPVFLLLTYNITGGLLPDPNMPGPSFIQEAIAYATVFITLVIFRITICFGMAGCFDHHPASF